MVRRILGFSLACVLAASLGVSTGCSGSPKKTGEPPQAKNGDDDAKPVGNGGDTGGSGAPAPPVTPVPAVAGKWTRSSDGAVFAVEDDGTTVTGKLESDPSGTFDEFAFVLKRDGSDLVGKAKFKAKSGAAAETAWKVHAEGPDKVVGDNEVVAIDPDTGELAEFLGRRSVTQPFTVVRPEPVPPPKVEEPPPPAKVEQPTPPVAKVEEPSPPPAKTEEPSQPTVAKAEQPTPPPTTTEPTPPPAKVEEPPPPAKVEQPTPPPAKVEEPPPAKVEQPTPPPPAKVEEPPPAKVEQPTPPPPAKVEEPTPPPPAKVEEPKPTPPPQPVLAPVPRQAVVVKRANGDEVRGLVFDRGGDLVVRSATGDTVIAKADIMKVSWVPLTAEEEALTQRLAPPAHVMAPAPVAKVEEPKPAEPTPPPPVAKVEEPKPAEPTPPPPVAKVEEPKPAEPTPPPPVAKVEEPKPAEPTPPPPVAKVEEPKPAEPTPPPAEPTPPPPVAKVEEPKPAEPAPPPTAKVEQPETPNPGAKACETPSDLLKAIASALRAKDKDALKALALDDDELAKSVGESRAARARKGILDKLELDYSRLAADEPGAFRGTYADSPQPEIGKKKLRDDPSVVEVEFARNPTLTYEVDGVSKTLPLGQLVRVGDGGWKILTLLPAKALKPAEPTPPPVAKAEEPKPAEPTPPPVARAEEPKPAEPTKPEEPKPPETAPTPTAKVEQPESPKPAAKVLAAPNDLLKAIVDALRAKDKDALAALALDEDELAKSVGEKLVAKARTGILGRIEADYGRLAADEPAVFRGTYVDTPAPEVGHKKLRDDPSVVEVEFVAGPTLTYEVDGARKTLVLGQLVKVGDGGWKILSLLPAKR